MSGRVPQTTPRKLIKALQKLGFQIVRIKGSHHSLRRGNRIVTVAYHNVEMSRPLFFDILKDAGVSLDEIRRYL